MTETLTQLVGRINLPNGETPEKGKISFSLSDWDKDGADIFVTGPVSFDLSEDGDLIDCYLQSTLVTNRQQVYLPIVSYWSRLRNRLMTVGLPPISVPSFGPVDIAELLQIPVTVPVAPDVLAQAIAAKVAAELAAAKAQAFGASYAQTDAELLLITIDPAAQVLHRLPTAASEGQQAPVEKLTTWKRETGPTLGRPYWTDASGAVFVLVGLTEELLLSVVGSAINGLATDPVYGVAAFSSLAAFNAANIPAAVKQARVLAPVIPPRSQRILVFSAQAGAAITGIKAGWVPDGEIFAKAFGAAEDYNDTADVGTDDLIALNRATAYAATLGKYVWIDDASYVSGPVRPSIGCRGFKATRPVGSSTSQVGGPAWPSGYKLGSAIIGGHLEGPVVHLRYSDQWCNDVELGGTAARYAAPISTGSGNINTGLLIEPPDASGQSLSRSGANRCLFRNQPVEGWIMSGPMTSLNMIDNSSINCGRHGFIIDNGTTAGRTYLGKPGIITVRGDRQINCGGHEYKIGHESAGVDQPYRVTIDRAEGFRAGNNPSMLVEDAAVYILGEQVTVLNTAASATSGLTGATPTLAHAYAIGGRGNSVNGSRGIGYTEEPILILQSPWESDPDGSSLIVTGAHNANDAAPNPVNLIKHNGQIIDLYIDNVSGNFDGYPIDLTGFLGSAIIDYNGVLTYHGKDFRPLNTAVQGWFAIGNGFNAAPEVTIASGAVTLTVSAHKIDTEGDAALDDLEWLNGSAPEGTIVLLRLATSTRQINLKHLTGNMRLGGRDRLLASSSDYAIFIKRSTTWDLVVFSDSTGKLFGAALDVSGNAVIGGSLTVGNVSANVFSGRKFTVADDAAVYVQLSGTYGYGVLIIAGSTLTRGAIMVHFRAGTSPFCSKMSGPANAVASLGVLAGTTGVDGELTISTHTDGRVYLENRTGSSTEYVLSFLSMNLANGLPT